MSSKEQQESGRNTQLRKVTVAMHTRVHAERLCHLLKREGVSAELVSARLGYKFTDHPMEIRIKEDDIPAALRIIENIEIFPLDVETSFSEIAEKEGSSTQSDKLQVYGSKRVSLRRRSISNSMQSGKIILVPIDFSDYSFTATRLAFDMASKHNASVMLLYAYVVPSRTDSFAITADSGLLLDAGDEVSKEICDTARKNMDEFSERIREYIKTGIIPAVKFSTEVIDGLAEEVILEYSRNTQPMMIVMGTRGADKKESDMIGSVTAEVLDSCRSVAFTVPENMRLPIPAEGMRQAAFFANLDDDDLIVLDKVYELFPNASFHISLVYAGRKRWRSSSHGEEQVVQDMNNLLNYCKKHYQGYNFEIKTVTGISDIEDFERMQNERPMEIIIIPNKRKNALARLFNPGLAHRLLFHYDIPMLVVPV